MSAHLSAAELADWATKAASAIYLATEAGVADDISKHLKAISDHLCRSATPAEVREVVEALRKDAADEIEAGNYDKYTLLQKAATLLESLSAQEARNAALGEALAPQPPTAEDPNEDAYQRGRFDGVMEYAKAILALKGDPQR